MTIGRMAPVLVLAVLTGTAAYADDGDWRTRRDALLRDAHLVRRYTFADTVKGKGRAVDLSGSGKDLTFVPAREDGKVIDDLRVIEGRITGARAVQLSKGWFQGNSVDAENRALTVMCWFRVRPGDGGDQVGTMLCTEGWTRGWRLIGADPLAFAVGTREGCAKAMARAHLPQGQWHHVAGTWDGATVELFVNGKSVASSAHSGPYIPAAATDAFKVGFDQDGGLAPLPIDIDEVCIFSRALTREDIAVLSTREPDPAESIFKAADRHCAAGDAERAREEYRKLAALASLEHGKELALFNIAESYRLEKAYARAHTVYAEILALPGLSAPYRAYALFRQAEVYAEQEAFDAARQTYREILAADRVTDHRRFMAGLAIADTFRSERKYEQARGIYRTLLRQQETSSCPHDGYRLDLIDRLEAIDGLADGREWVSRRKAREEWVNRPRRRIVVATQGSDDQTGTEDNPFATIARARDEVRRIKREQGIPDGGIAVCLRGGKYFLEQALVFGGDDSGAADSPIVYRSFPGEQARIIGGRGAGDADVVDAPAILARLPEEARGKVWCIDLKAAGIGECGPLRNRGGSGEKWNAGGMEAFCDTRPLRLARWPKQGWLSVADMVDPEGDGKAGGIRYQKGKFRYAEDRPGRWTAETDIWVTGYFMRPWDKMQTKVLSLDTDRKIAYLSTDVRWWSGDSHYHMPVRKGKPYFFYNVLGELSEPVECYIDRAAGKLYFYPPDPNGARGREVIVSTLDVPMLKLKDVSNVSLLDLTLECTQHHAIELRNCSDVLVANSTIRNTGNAAVVIKGGWRNSVVGCDIYDTGEGGVILNGGDRETLVPGGHVVENNHIYRFNRFSHGAAFAVGVSGVGHRISHNLIHDGTYIAVAFSGNDHVIEYNEIYDVMYEARDGGAIYTYGAPLYLMNRGNVMRYNFLHHITEHSSPLKTHQVTGIYIDALNAGMTMLGNVLYRHTERALFTHGPDTRIENNIFVDNHMAITQSNRTYLLRSAASRKRWRENVLDWLEHRRPPWSSRYPQVAGILEEKEPWAAPRRIAIERNVVTGGPFTRISGDFDHAENTIADNWEDGRAFFRNVDKLDFRLRPGSPVFGVTGHTPVPFEQIGLYPDALRASWPVTRRYGKYYEPGRQKVTQSTGAKFPPLPRVSKAQSYKVRRRRSTIIIDGKLDPAEWGGLDRSRAIVVEQAHVTGARSTNSRNYAWLLFDDNCLYVGVEHAPDPWREGLTKDVSVVVHEWAIETPIGSNTWWWEEGLPTGPLHVFSGRPKGNFTVHNLFGMPQGVTGRLEKSIEYRAKMIDAGQIHWTAEWRVPLAAINLDPRVTRNTRFSIGGVKREGWLCWVATGGSIWRVDNAGVVEFVAP